MCRKNKIYQNDLMMYCVAGSSVASDGAGGADCPNTRISFPEMRTVNIPKISKLVLTFSNISQHFLKCCKIV